MKIVSADKSSEQKKFLAFRKNIYRNAGKYIDNNYFMIQEIFSEKIKFTKKIKTYPVNIKDENDRILCQGIIIYADRLPEYIQLCFFESLEGHKDAVSLLVSHTVEKGREFGCSRLVIGLYGHVNYGLGFLDSHFEDINSFSSCGNPKYYNDYFRDMNCEEIKLNSYRLENRGDNLKKYSSLIAKLNKRFDFKFFDKKQFDYYLKIYTDLNNKCFVNHRYYYKRDYEDDREMLEELFLFMKEDSLIFAFYDNKPVGFIMWYPDYNELAKRGEIFGAKHFIKNIFLNKKIETAKVMEFGVIDEFKKVGLPIALIDKIFERVKKYGCVKAETSWILAENINSNRVCSTVCDEKYKEYVVYEKEI